MLTPPPLTDWDKTCQFLESVMATMRKVANEPIPPTKQILIDDRTEAEKLRDTAWENYRYQQDKRICSRCGNYSRYETFSVRTSVAKELNSFGGYDFHHIDYDIKTTPIVNENSNDSEWGNLCTRCKDHILGRKPYPLASSKAETEEELRFLKGKERTRRMYQEDDIRAARKEHNKELKDNAEQAISTAIKNQSKPKLNPNDGRTNKANRVNWRAEK